MTYLFRKFTETKGTEGLYLPGAPFIFGAALSLLALILFISFTTKAERDARFTDDQKQLEVSKP